MLLSGDLAVGARFLLILTELGDCRTVLLVEPLPYFHTTGLLDRRILVAGGISGSGQSVPQFQKNRRQCNCSLHSGIR